MSRFVVAGFIALGALVLNVAAAHAQPTDDEAAYDLNEAGLEAFEEQRFEDAARAFAKAWTLSRDESLRKNEALAWFRAGRCDEAVVAANKFLLTDQIEEADRNDIHSVIANCKVDFAKRAVDAAHLDLAENLLRDADASAQDDFTRDRIAAVRVDLAAARDAAAVPLEPEIRTVFVSEPSPPVLEIGLIATGATIAAGALTYHLVAHGWQREFFRMERGEVAADEARFNQLRKRVHVARVLVPLLYAVGVGTAAAGATMLVLVEPEPDGGAVAWFTLRGEF